MSYFSYVGRIFSNVKGFYNEINAATLTGAIDAVIVKQEDGSYLSSPFHVRFGKLGVLRAREKVVDIEINGVPVEMQMKLGESGEAFFVEELPGEENEEDFPSYLATSPLPSTSDLMMEGVKEMKQEYLNTAGNTIQVIPPQTSESNISIMIEDEDSRKKKVRRKKRPVRRTSSSEDTSKAVEKSGDEIFNMDDVSTDDELANLEMRKPNVSPRLGKSVSLSMMDETQESRLERTSQWALSQYSFGHPFSDTDMSPLASPANTRPPSPKSDTEVDRQRQGEVDQSILSEEDSTMWEWGDLPRRSEHKVLPIESGNKEAGAKNGESQENKGLFKFMKKTKAVRHKPEGEGIYLDDLNLEEMDPEVAKLYFPKRFHSNKFVSIKERTTDQDEDTESGRGPSLPVSPHSVEGAIGGPPGVSFLKSEVQHLGNYSLSLCGGLSDPDGVNLEKFMTHIVTFGDLCENFNMITNPDLVVRIGENYYNWQTAAPIILCQVCFEKDLPEKSMNDLMKEHMPKKKTKKGGMSSWFSWRRTTSDTSNPASAASPETDVHTTKSAESSASMTPPVSQPGSPRKSQRRITDESQKSECNDTSCDDLDTEDSDPSGQSAQPNSESPLSSKPIDVKPSKEKFKKTLRLSSDQIKKLNLHEGQNEISFSVTTQFQGTTRCTSHIYLWRYDDKIVVSDIDGTITKSDVLGQILPIIGRDWSQSGVAQLFTHINNNGYKFLYLSARAIGQSKVTKDLLRSIKQEYHVLPDGPLLLSPTSLVSAFHREVIERKPEDFKIACLRDIGELFTDSQPFYAGFGNKINDVYAYKAINIPTIRIFTINHRGELKQESSYTFQSSYYSLTEIADHFFPPRERLGVYDSHYSTVRYWRDPLPKVLDQEISIVEVGKKEEK
ncbi:phosphatidate phosphatase LPIN2-like isoform X2 [Ostrea edulis]|uniref:phosphatidate phosphatase LPIN2-like isoform X2 n=1 Tax=Ostrea edulis TaxID=37623 RepID=UPI0024AFD13C|nr:phosphatidate phosphatase LPIN2-like isoform X2 [Ostrea edulis]XP_055996005.1 phosphatidate phosphatase LPIN2-like isoform X2 [Ostrea edulis]XP_055996006.1 phosphatidate phosphatase LPIN2-like isoform X2 [Ostrea edulis]XP_055996007.1 phosphatidate phosphatase LPIN2-like isoform X2 [Ostrea edulis]XP_055996008.1 phosphatidate phosphatase LPIN2-like isoform X2 [Ostrea edulis]XP_055996009.1 phosphatidate phosphatase LPIN2-like isoform X2 [Ostrea edulis]